MAEKKTAAKKAVKKAAPRKPRIVEGPPTSKPWEPTIEIQEGKNGEKAIIVSGHTALPLNAPVEIRTPSRTYNGGIAQAGFFRAAIPFTEEPIEVWSGGERL